MGSKKHPKNIPMYSQCPSAKDYQESTIAELGGFTVHCSEGKYTSWGIMGHFSKKVSERTFAVVSC